MTPDRPIAALFTPTYRSGTAARLAGIPVRRWRHRSAQGLGGRCGRPRRGGASARRTAEADKLRTHGAQIKKGSAYFYANPLITWLPEVGSNH